jgi:hypothetical protein
MIKSICGPQTEIYLTLEQLQIIEQVLKPISKQSDEHWRAYKKIAKLAVETEDYQKERY